MRWKKSKNSEDCTNQADNEKSYPGMKPACVLPLEKQGFTPECGSRSNEKDSDVEPIYGGAQNAV